MAKMTKRQREPIESTADTLKMRAAKVIPQARLDEGLIYIYIYIYSQPGPVESTFDHCKMQVFFFRRKLYIACRCPCAMRGDPLRGLMQHTQDPSKPSVQHICTFKLCILCKPLRRINQLKNSSIQLVATFGRREPRIPTL